MAGNYKMSDHRRGDTAFKDGFKFTLEAVPPIDLSGAVAKIDFRVKPDRESELGQSLSSGEGGGLVLDVGEGSVTIPAFNPTLGAAVWFWDLQLEWAALPPFPLRLTYMAGTWKITPDTTE